MSQKKRSAVTVALAMGLGVSLVLSARVAAADPAPSLPAIPELQDPQLDSASTGGTFPPLGGPTEDPPAAAEKPSPRIDSTAIALRQRELVDSPMAPLPPAIVAGPIGIALAGWMAVRANRRGGRI